MFEPDPRVGARQVTCRAGPCQASRHADRCRKWREANPEVTSRHYEDVVVPYRQRRPWYQRAWRFACRVSEIREKMRGLGGGLVGAARSLLNQAKSLFLAVPEGVATGGISGVFVSDAAAALTAAVDALEVVERSMAKLATLGS